MADANEELVLLERRDDGVAVITLNNPKVNALSQELLGRFTATAQRLPSLPTAGATNARKSTIVRAAPLVKKRADHAFVATVLRACPSISGPFERALVLLALRVALRFLFLTQPPRPATRGPRQEPTQQPLRHPAKRRRRRPGARQFRDQRAAGPEETRPPCFTGTPSTTTAPPQR